MFTTIYEHLKQTGFEVYSIGQHEGLCNAPYVVIKENSQQPFSMSLAYDVVDILVFFPLGKYSEVKVYMHSVMNALKALKPLKPTHEITPIIIDTDKKAYTTSVKYQIFKRRDS